MPKIIKSMREDSLYGSKAPKYFLDAKKVRFQIFFSGNSDALLVD